MIQITLSIEGMMCNNCVRHVEEAIKGTGLAKKYVVDKDAKNAVITAKEGVDIDVFRQAITDAGYTVTGVATAAIEKKGFFAKLKK